MITLTKTKPINIKFLSQELDSAGYGIVTIEIIQDNIYIDLDPIHQSSVQTIVDNHDASQLTVLQQISARHKEIRQNALVAVSDVPDYFRWTPQEGIDFIDTNVTDLPSAIVVLKGMWRMLCVLRDITVAQKVAELRQE